MRVQLIFGECWRGVCTRRGVRGITFPHTIRTGGHRERRTGLPRGEGERAIRDIAIVEVGYGGGGAGGGKVTEQGRLITERVSAKHENEEKNDGSKHDERSLSGVILGQQGDGL